ncbi:PilX N-terminal domain-containing pilus assembly protein [Telluria mixta]|uniref:PilX N-terminal domain-containing pilus assembly protein n=1 Tax=Telluria mixta TaxID=34071 RepID=A0ABT2C6Q0_9BURK|nr:PilX N-terminal domain-containing pilus assembly protein [Telluria mixta]MCS0633070.1 PilX N-terminal domain-containing pilus assembly protein [Telluria mixta]WEM96115.1 PilX N-terminal domain-containing pilus assembly protein [Telluria mixta]
MKPTASERGLALVCALTLMVAAMVIGVAITRGAFVLLASARNERDRDVAQAAAEAALRDAEHDIAGAAGVPPGRAAHFGAAGGHVFTDDCGQGTDDLGLCRARSPPAWQTLDLADAENPALVPYGRFTGAALPVGRGALPARLPAYVIERIAPAGATAQMGSFYRVTAIGFGTRTSTRVVLQSLVRLPPPAEGAGGEHGHGNDGDEGHDDGNDDAHGRNSGNGSGDRPPARPPERRPPERRLPSGRIGWREIANWDELHAHAGP